MKFTTKNVVVGISLSLILAVTFVPQLFARDGEPGGTTTTPTTTPTTTKSGGTDGTTQKSTEPVRTEPTETPQSTTLEDKADNPRSEVRKEIAREKLDDTRKAKCESHQSEVNTAMEDVIQRSKNHFDRITSIYTMTTKFYVEKGLSVNNYQTLVANVEAAKVVAGTADNELTGVPQFSCTSDGPKADIQAFRNKRLDKVDAFGAYRDAVKTLVKAVRDAAQSTTSTTTGGTK